MNTIHRIGMLTLLVMLPAAMVGPVSAQTVPTTAREVRSDRSPNQMADGADLRRNLWTSLYTAPHSSLEAVKPATYVNAWGTWQSMVRTVGNAAYIILSPAQDGQWPVYAQGSTVVKRSLVDGSFMQIKLFLRSDPGTFARIYPDRGRSRMDIVVYGGVLYRQVPVPLPFEDVVRSSYGRIRDLTADVIDWDLFSPDPFLYGDILRLVDGIRAGLPGLRYADDGAVDADGRAVLIDTLADQPQPTGLNCSGFAKWITDGIVYPVSGRYLSVAELKTRMLDWRGSSFTQAFEEKYDPFFGLDWGRALARAAWAAFHPASVYDSPLANDVRDAPFALQVSDSDPVNGGSDYIAFSDNFDDAGLDIRGLKATLFVLASREPGHFYLAQFNARDPEPPNLRRYFHMAALFPWFDRDGVFRVTVFESAAETSLERITGDKDYEFVKLIRMPAPSRFSPLPLPAP